MLSEPSVPSGQPSLHVTCKLGIIKAKVSSVMAETIVQGINVSIAAAPSAMAPIIRSISYLTPARPRVSCATPMENRWVHTSLAACILFASHYPFLPSIINLLDLSCNFWSNNSVIAVSTGIPLVKPSISNFLKDAFIVLYSSVNSLRLFSSSSILRKTSFGIRL